MALEESKTETKEDTTMKDGTERRFLRTELYGFLERQGRGTEERKEQRAEEAWRGRGEGCTGRKRGRRGQQGERVE